MFFLFVVFVLLPSAVFANDCLNSTDNAAQVEISTSNEINSNNAKKDILKDTLKSNQSDIVEEVDSSKNIKQFTNEHSEVNNIHDVIVNYYDNDNKNNTISPSLTTHVVGDDLNTPIPIGDISAELVSCKCDNNNVSVSVINNGSVLTIKGNLESNEPININLYYNLSSVSYTVHYMLENNDNQAFSEKKTSVYHGENNAEVPNLNQINEIFDGYVLSHYASKKLGYLSKNNVYIYYKWVRHSVEFDCNGGVGGPATLHLKSGESFNAPGQIPYKDGMTFECWCLDSECKKAAVFPYASDSDENIKLYARWGQKQEEPIVTVVKWLQNPNAKDQKLRHSEQRVNCVFGESFQYTGDAPKNTTLIENPVIVPDASSNNVVDVIYEYEERTIWFFDTKEKANAALKLSNDEEKLDSAIGFISGQIGQDIYDKSVAVNSTAFTDGQGWWTDVETDSKFTSFYTIEDHDLYVFKDMPESDNLAKTLNVWTLKLDASEDWDLADLPLTGDVENNDFELKETLKVQSVPDEYPELLGFETPTPNNRYAPSTDTIDDILNCYYIRNSYSIIFYDGVSSSDCISDIYGVRFGQSINALSVNLVDDNGTVHETKITDYVPKHPDNRVVPSSLVFGGWYMSTVKSGERVDLSDTNLVMPDRDLELYAKYVPVKYEVKFHDFDKKIIKTISVNAGGKIQLTDVPNASKDGYEFVSWQYAGIDGNYIDFDLGTDTVQGNLDLYPNFRKIIIDDDKDKSGDTNGDGNTGGDDDDKDKSGKKDGDDNTGGDDDNKGKPVNEDNNNDENGNSLKNTDLSSFDNDSGQSASNDNMHFTNNSKSDENNLLVSTGDATPIVYIVISLILSVAVLISLKVKKIK